MDGAYPKEEKESKRQMTIISVIFLILIFMFGLIGSFYIGFRAGLDRAIRAWVSDNIKVETFDGGIRVRIKGDEK